MVSSDTDKSTNSDFDNDNDNEDNQDTSYSSSSSSTRRSSNNNKNVNIFGFQLPSDTVNLVTGVLAAIGTVGTGLYLYDRYNNNKLQQEQQKKQQEEAEVQELIRNLQERSQQQQQIQNSGGNPPGQTYQGQQPQSNQTNGVYINPEMFSNSEYLKALNRELDGGNTATNDNNSNDLPMPTPEQQQQPPMINMGHYANQETRKQQQQIKQSPNQQPQVDTSIYQSSQAPDPTTYF